MKANELMIGDWYAFRGHPYKCTASDIASIAECEEKGAQTDISEIPITSEILEKNGFEKRKDCDPYIYYFLKEKDNYISLSKEWDSITRTIYWSLSVGNHITDANLSINYIHELQHAIRLCGIEKDIVL